MRVLVCGDRNWRDRDYIFSVLDRSRSVVGIEVVIEGGARGADAIAASWAIERGIELESFPAEWETFGRSAGPRRNQVMLNTKPDLVIAFHKDLKASKGTKDMVERARKAEIPTWVMPEFEPMLDTLESGAYV